MTGFLEECCWWIKAKMTSEEAVQEERARLHFESKAKLELLKGAVFEWKKTVNQSSGAAGLLSSALSSFSRLSGTEVAATIGGSTTQVMLRLQFPDKPKHGAPAPAVMDKVANFINGDENVTVLAWSSLELEKNEPKYSGRVPLHMIQTIKEREGWLVLCDHQNNVLFEGKSSEVSNWADYVKEALKILAPQIEDEGAASRGVTYRSKQLEKLEARQQEWEEKRKKLGNVTMAYTARAMMNRESAASNE